MALEGQDALKAMTNLFRGFWPKQTPDEAILLSLKEPTAGYEKPVTESMVRLYTAALVDLTQEKIILAFSRAATECKFFPSPATLREFSGRPVTGDPIAAEAKAELLHLINEMRSKHGPKLADIEGRILYGTEYDPKDANGERVPPCDAPRAESTPYPIARRTEAALVRLDWGIVVGESPTIRRWAECRSLTTSSAAPTRS